MCEHKSVCIWKKKNEPKQNAAVLNFKLNSLHFQKKSARFLFGWGEGNFSGFVTAQKQQYLTL